MRRLRLLRGLTACLLPCLLVLAGCAASQPRQPGSSAAPRSHVDVDTPALRSAKRAAGIEPCRPGSASSDLPDRTLACLGGGPAVRLSTVGGPLVINLFAQWCGPCRAEMPYYQRLHEKAEGRLRVLGIDYLDTRPDAALRLAGETGVTYPLLADPDGTLRPDFGIRGLPGLVLVGADGSVDVQFRVVRSYAELRDLVEEGLGVTVPA